MGIVSRLKFFLILFLSRKSMNLEKASNNGAWKKDRRLGTCGPQLDYLKYFAALRNKPMSYLPGTLR